MVGEERPGKDPAVRNPGPRICTTNSANSTEVGFSEFCGISHKFDKFSKFGEFPTVSTKSTAGDKTYGSLFVEIVEFSVFPEFVVLIQKIRPGLIFLNLLNLRARFVRQIQQIQPEFDFPLLAEFAGKIQRMWKI